MAMQFIILLWGGKMQEFSLQDVQVKVIPSNIARDYTLKHHYMKTFPNSIVCFGVFYKGKLSGAITFGYSTATDNKVKKIVPKIQKNEYLEMQRMNIMDNCGKNTESYVLGKIMGLLKSKGIRLVITHAGGCKNDCGIVYQSSAWLYFGKEKCDDFYLTDNGEYKNIVAPIRFGRVPKEIVKKGAQAVGEYLFGKGNIVKSFRYTYIYPIDKGIRHYLQKKALPYPKDSAMFRKDGVWYKNEQS